MGKSWNDLSESEKAEMRNRASSIRDDASQIREELEARTQDGGGSFLDKLFSSFFRTMERTANNVSKRK